MRLKDKRRRSKKVDDEIREEGLGRHNDTIIRGKGDHQAAEDGIEMKKTKLEEKKGDGRSR